MKFLIANEIECNNTIASSKKGVLFLPALCNLLGFVGVNQYNYVRHHDTSSILPSRTHSPSCLKCTDIKRGLKAKSWVFFSPPQKRFG